jgi:membrane-bound serine protease (ClpP class)
MHNAVMRRVLVLAGLLVGLIAALSMDAWAQGSGRVVDVVQIKGFIDPPTASYLEERIAAAQSSPSTEALIIELDSAGGLVDSAPEIARRIVESRVPVVVWVAPRGAVAASAGALLLSAGDLAYMASDTRVGSAFPVNLNAGSPRPDGVKTAELVRRLAALNGRDIPAGLTQADASMASVRASESGVIDGIASSLADVLKRIDGQNVATTSGSSAPLDTWDEAANRPTVGFRFEEVGLVARTLHAFVSPETAFLLLLLGAFGLIFETYNPGIGLAAIIGLAALAGSFYALNLLPTDWLGVLVAMVGIGLFVVDVQLSGFGIWSAGGIAGVAAGGWLMFSDAPTAARLSPWAIAAGVALSLLFFVSVMTAALRVRLRRPITGEEGIVGTVGEARTDIAPEGTVFTKGKLWRARTMEMGIAAGSMVEIKATEGLVLLVEPSSGHGGAEASALDGEEAPVARGDED